jgi:hypothetical protein
MHAPHNTHHILFGRILELMNFDTETSGFHKFYQTSRYPFFND